jgi:hypothetical protein
VKQNSSPTKSKSRPQTAGEGGTAEDHGDVLNQSLSSAFFRGLKPNQSVEPSPQHQQQQQQPPFITSPDHLMSPENNEQTPINTNEKKLRESAATMAKMRERLRVMESSETFSRVPTAASNDIDIDDEAEEEERDNREKELEKSFEEIDENEMKQIDEEIHNNDNRPRTPVPFAVSSAAGSSAKTAPSAKSELPTPLPLTGSLGTPVSPGVALDEVNHKTKEFKQILR